MKPFSHFKQTLFLVLVLCSLSFTLGTPIFKTTNNNPQPSETIIATIETTGTYIDSFTKKNIHFYDGQKEISPSFEAYQYENTIYLFVTFTKEGTYRLETDEILYSLAGEVGSKKVEHTFSVAYKNKVPEHNQTNTTDSPKSNEITDVITVKPGVIYTVSNTSQLRLFNRGSNDLDIRIADTSFTLGAYQAKVINVNLQESLSFITIKTYKTFTVPVIYLGEVKQMNNTNQSNETTIIESGLLIRPSEINSTLSKGETRIRTIELANTGSNRIKNVTLLSNISGVKVSFPNEIETKTTLNLSVTVTGDTNKSEKIVLSYIENNVSFNLSIPLFVTVKAQPKPDTLTLSCLEYGGTLCNDVCEGESNFSSDGLCCYGTCVPFEKPPEDTKDGGGGLATGWLIGLLILFVLAIMGYMVYKKYKKTTPQKPEEKLALSKERYENRLKGAVTRH